MVKRFSMVRGGDESGVSGVGHVLDGVEFQNGKVAVTWYGKGDVDATSVAVYDSFDDFHAIHVASHPSNNTDIRWED